MNTTVQQLTNLLSVIIKLYSVCLSVVANNWQCTVGSVEGQAA